MEGGGRLPGAEGGCEAGAVGAGQGFADVGELGVGDSAGFGGRGQVLGPGEGGAEALEVLGVVGVGVGGEFDDGDVDALPGQVFGGLAAEGVGGPAAQVGVLGGAGDGVGELDGAGAGTGHDEAAAAVEEDGGNKRPVEQVAGEGAGLGL